MRAEKEFDITELFPAGFLTLALLAAFSFGGDLSRAAEQSPGGKARVWPLYDIENKRVMVFDDFDIRAKKEAGVNIVDWDGTCFLTKHHCFQHLFE